MMSIKGAGFVLVDKPAGMSSAAVVARVKSRLKVRKAGHAGTLDPFATGLLVVLINGATRFASYVGGGAKRYTGTLLFGRVTTTDDVTGETISEHTVPAVTAGELQQIVEQFQGTISQVPPQISAVKVAGKPAYRRARAGEELSLSARQVHVHAFSLIEKDAERYEYQITCGPGTYVRALVRDVGAVLGCGACVETLRREFSAPFEVAGAVPLDEVESAHVREWTEMFPAAPRVMISAAECAAVRSGNQRALEAVQNVPQVPHHGTPVALYGDRETGLCAGILVCQDGHWKVGVNL